jgi:DNA-directed RNA polymerase subunit RPC12/RpoP
MKSAEWICTKCGTTNRALLPSDRTTDTDRCVSCHLKHMLTPGDRPVRWEATATK